MAHYPDDTHPDWSQVPDSQIPTRRVELPTTGQKAGRFIPPMPLAWFTSACALAGKAQARVTILLKTGERLAVFVEHAIGSVENPMSDAMLEDKFRGLSEGILSSGTARRIIDLCWGADRLADAGEIARSAGRS